MELLADVCPFGKRSATFVVYSVNWRTVFPVLFREGRGTADEPVKMSLILDPAWDTTPDFRDLVEIGIQADHGRLSIAQVNRPRLLRGKFERGEVIMHSARRHAESYPRRLIACIGEKHNRLCFFIEMPGIRSRNAQSTATVQPA